MKKVLKNVFVALSISLFVLPVYAEKIDSATAKKNIAKLFNGVTADKITPSPIDGIYQVSAPPRIFYVSADGRYILKGDLIDAIENKNISQIARNQAVKTAVDSVGEDSMIIFGDKSLKHTVTVFTDIDCGYCRKLHNEIKKYNDNGIRIRYMSYPRAGIGSGSFNKAEAVWCSKDRKKALTDAKNNINVKSEKCKSPVAKHYTLGTMMGINGTPALVLEDGTIVPGYIPASRLSQGLEQADKQKK